MDGLTDRRIFTYLRGDVFTYSDVLVHSSGNEAYIDVIARRVNDRFLEMRRFIDKRPGEGDLIVSYNGLVETFQIVARSLGLEERFEDLEPLQAEA